MAVWLPNALRGIAAVFGQQFRVRTGETTVPTVLVVDDSLADRRLVCEYLRKRGGWSVCDAANGQEALARIEQVGPDVVLTDLHMPTMDGLQLVAEMRRHYPHVPVIITTAYGSESAACEALERGAASYVPKAKLADRLLETMENVLALARADRMHARLIQCLESTEFRFFLENDPNLIDPLVDLVQQMVQGVELTDFAGRLRIGVALKEALLNAVFHGNLEISPEEMREVRERLLEEHELSLVEQRWSQAPYRDRRVFVHVVVSRNEARFLVRDEGRGFNPQGIPLPTELGALEAERGRGLALMRSFMDEVLFNEAGNEVTMIKRKETPGDDGAQQSHGE